MMRHGEKTGFAAAPSLFADSLLRTGISGPVPQHDGVSGGKPFSSRNCDCPR
jgi:hypothetical protein